MNIKKGERTPYNDRILKSRPPEISKSNHSIPFPFPDERCVLKADIVLLVDGSASISAFGTTATGDPNFYKNHIFKFLENIISKFDVSPEGTHIGVVFFGKKNMEEVKNKVSRNIFELRHQYIGLGFSFFELVLLTLSANIYQARSTNQPDQLIHAGLYFSFFCNFNALLCVFLSRDGTLVWIKCTALVRCSNSSSRKTKVRCSVPRIPEQVSKKLKRCWRKVRGETKRCVKTLII